MRHKKRIGAVLGVLLVGALAYWTSRPRPLSIELLESGPPRDHESTFREVSV